MPDKTPNAGEQPSSPVKVRVLTTCTYGAVNSVATLDASVASQAEAEGLVDSAPAAVAYAEQLAAEAASKA